MFLISLLLDLANIVGGFILAIGLLALIPNVGPALGRGADRIGPFAWVVGVVALVCGGFYLILHVLHGPGVLIFEVVAIITGVLLLWDRLRMRRLVNHDIPRSSNQGAGLVLAIYGVIAIIVGIDGLLTPG